MKPSLVIELNQSRFARLDLRWSIGLAILSAAIGVALAVNAQVGIVVFAAAMGISASAGSTAAWIGAALSAALLAKGLSTVGALPSVASFMDIPLSWGALAVAALKRRPAADGTRLHMKTLGAVAACVACSSIINPAEPLRPVLYLALLGEPFAAVGALMLDPPSTRERRHLRRLLIALILLQVPIAYLQFSRFGISDHVQGTLVGAGAGAHTMSAVVLVGALWLLLSSNGRLRLRRSVLVLAMLLIPFLADAKQVLLATPAIVLAGRWRGRMAAYVVQAVLIAGVVAALFYIYPAGANALRFLHQSENGRGGKEAVAGFIWHKLDTDPGSLLAGKGPAETVSRAAFMTTDLYQRANSPLRILGLKPAAIALEAQSLAVADSGGGTSLNSGLSSAFGVIGDIGLLGFAAYVLLLGQVIVALRRRRSPEAVAATGGWAMWAVLGFVFDWWEQPPFGLVLAVLSGLALTADASSRRDLA